jgi:hypothetical protein
MDGEKKFTLTLFQSRKNPRGKQAVYTWPELVEVFKNPHITDETVAEYQAMTNEQKTEVKDVGGYVAGVFRNNRRGKSALENRQILTIDVDHAKPRMPVHAALFCLSCLVHSTHSSTTEQPRYRWLFPLSRPVNTAEYRYLANAMAREVGAEAVDETTDQAERLMFWPSVSFDAEYYVDANLDDEFLDPDKYLPDDLPEEPVKEKAPVQDGALEIAEGQRNKTVFEFAATLRGKGLDPSGIREMLEQYNERYCSPPLESFELDTICRSVCSRYNPGDAVTSLRDAWDDFNDLGTWQEKKPEQETKLESFASLNARRIEPPDPVVKGMIYPGLTLLASPPKFGKSWLCLDLAISVSNGTEFMGCETRKCGVIYYALEDSDWRLQDRLRKVAGDRELSDHALFTTHAKTLSEGLLDDLHKILGEHKDTGLIIIDTVQKVRGVPKKSVNLYALDYEEYGKLQAFAMDHNLAVVLVTHTNKNIVNVANTDAALGINGSTATPGSADTFIVLTRTKRGDKETMMKITGRDVIARDLVIEMDWGRYRWTVLGEERDVAARKEELEFARDPLVKTIDRLLDEAQEMLPEDSDADQVSLTLSSSDLLEEMTRLYGSQDLSAVGVGKRIEALEPRLASQLGVDHRTAKTTGGRRTHIFTREIV